MTTFSRSVPRIDRATSAPRLSAIVKTVRSSVCPTQSHAFSLASAHDVSSMCADGAATIAAAISATTGSSTSAARRSSLEIIPKEISNPNRSAVNCWIGRLASRYEPANMARIARRRGPKGPVGTPVGSSARVVVTAGAGQSVEAVFIDVGSDGRDLGDLVPYRLGVFPLQCAATGCAAGRLNLEGLPKLLGWDQGSAVSF